MKNSKFRNVQGRTFLNDGIHAATEINTRRIISAKDGGYEILRTNQEKEKPVS